MRFKKNLMSLSLFFLVFPSFTVLAGTAEKKIKIIIFSAPYGAGHDKVSEKIKTIIESEHPGAQVEIKNGQDFMYKPFRAYSQWAFDIGQSQLPELYSLFFEEYLEKAKKVKTVGDMPMVLSMRSEKLIEFIQEKKPDAILVAWPHIVEWMSSLRKKGYLKNTPIGWIHTDHVSSFGEMGYFEKAAMAVDHAFLPSESIRNDFISAGVPADRLTVSGMPLQLENRPELTIRDRMQRRRDMRVKLNLNPEHPVLMIEAGKNGIGNYPVMIASVFKSFKDNPVTVIAATGQNSEQFKQVEWLKNGVGNDLFKQNILYKKLKPLLRQGVSPSELKQWIRQGLPKNQIDIHSLKFVPLNEWRIASDLVATKPGGLSTAEMAAEGIPMILRSELASGQERYNVQRFIQYGMAVECKDESTLGSSMRSLMQDGAFLETLYKNSEKVRQMNRTEEIAKWTVESAERRQKEVAAQSMCFNWFALVLRHSRN